MIAIPFQNKVYHITPSIMTALEIEDTIGSLNIFYTDLENNTWTVNDLVSAVHILISTQNADIDFVTLGQDMLARGLNTYRRPMLSFLSSFLFSNNHRISK